MGPWQITIGLVGVLIGAVVLGIEMNRNYTESSAVGVAWTLSPLLLIVAIELYSRIW